MAIATGRLEGTSVREWSRRNTVWNYEEGWFHTGECRGTLDEGHYTATYAPLSMGAPQLSGLSTPERLNMGLECLMVNRLLATGTHHRMETHQTDGRRICYRGIACPCVGECPRELTVAASTMVSENKASVEQLFMLWTARINIAFTIDH